MHDWSKQKAKYLHNDENNICFVGSHVSALPRNVLSEDFIDIVFTNEGVYALHNLINLVKVIKIIGEIIFIKLKV